MTIAPTILEHYPDLNDAQRAAVEHAEGPLLVIAGPGSGKTYSIVLRAGMSRREFSQTATLDNPQETG